ncbi:MAG: RHS repeat-associated core domain-containing protein [Spirochaetota bacterium]
MAYDSYNRIISVTNTDTSEIVGRYWYDDQGFRVRKVAKRVVGSETRQVEVLYPSMYFGLEKQRDSAGTEVPNSVYSVNNIYLDGVRIAAVIPSGDARYYLTDQVDSVKVVADDNGLAVSRMEYMPYGETWFEEGDTNNAPKYNSQELDTESNFYYYNARHYSQDVARFVTPDTMIPRELDTQSWNRYSYCSNNPIIYKDPTGHYDFTGLESGNEVGDRLLESISDTSKAISGTKTSDSDASVKKAAKEAVESKMQKDKGGQDRTTSSMPSKTAESAVKSATEGLRIEDIKVYEAINQTNDMMNPLLPKKKYIEPPENADNAYDKVKLTLKHAKADVKEKYAELKDKFPIGVPNFKEGLKLGKELYNESKKNSSDTNSEKEKQQNEGKPVQYKEPPKEKIFNFILGQIKY